MLFITNSQSNKSSEKATGLGRSRKYIRSAGNTDTLRTKVSLVESGTAVARDKGSCFSFFPISLVLESEGLQFSLHTDSHKSDFRLLMFFPAYFAY